MILMQPERVIAHVKRIQNLFTLDFAHPGRTMMTMTIQLKVITTTGRAWVMAITKRGWPTYLVSQNKHIHLWYRQLVHVRHVRVVRASKLVESISLNQEDREYNSVEVFINSDDSDASDCSDQEESPIQLLAENIAEVIPRAIIQQMRIEDLKDFDKLCTPCVGSKSTQVVRRNKSMTVTTSKLEEIHADLWGLYESPSQSGSIYAAILICKYTWKTWTLYLKGKDNFINSFQAWLSRVKTESRCSMKLLQADGRGEFIFKKLRSFCKKRGIAIRYVAPYVHEKNRLIEQGWRTIVIIKDLMLINSSFPNNFWAEVIETTN